MQVSAPFVLVAVRRSRWMASCLASPGGAWFCGAFCCLCRGLDLLGPGGVADATSLSEWSR
jgi:hypothetical protein